MNRSPNPPTLRELVRPISAHRWLLLSIVVLAIAASIAYSETKKAVYTSQANVAYQDASYSLSLAGLAVTPGQTADQLAAAGAQTIIQPSVAAKVKAELGTSESTDTLINSVSATVSPSSNLVVVQASASTPTQARDIAQAFATQGAATSNDQLRAQYAAAYQSALARVRARHQPKPDATSQAVLSDELSRLQELSTIATTATVVRPAPLPTSPTSPKPARDAVLAAVLGIVLGLLAVYVRDAFDRRLQSVSDIEDQFALPMLGHVRTEALGRSPRTDGDRGPEPVDWELFRILRRNLDFLQADRVPKSIAVTSSLPEEGKSTVAAFLAFASAAAGKRTLLIECDLRRPVLADRLGVQRAPGLSDFVFGESKPQDILQVIPFGDPVSINGAHREAATNGHHAARAETSEAGEEGKVATEALAPQQYMHELVCITAGTPTQHPVEVLRSEAFLKMLAQVRDAYDVVILDTPPILSVADTLELLPHVDAAVVCVRVFSTTRQQAAAGRAALKRLPERPTGVVVTGTRRSTEGDYGYYGYYT